MFNGKWETLKIVATNVFLVRYWRRLTRNKAMLRFCLHRYQYVIYFGDASTIKVFYGIRQQSITR